VVEQVSQGAGGEGRLEELEREVRALRDELSRLTSGTKPNETRQERA
jgi:hypothetical protein